MTHINMYKDSACFGWPQLSTVSATKYFAGFLSVKWDSQPFTPLYVVVGETCRYGDPPFPLPV